MKICIVSGSTNYKLRSDINHRIYAKRHLYDYKFDVGPYPLMQNVYFFKLYATGSVLRRYDWVFWLDDDAYFTDLDQRLEKFIEDLAPKEFLAICKSPVTPRGQFVFLNSGVFLLRNCAEAFMFLERVKNTSLAVVKSWWDGSKFGMFTGGEQDAITYVVIEQKLLSRVRLMPYDAFNSRPYHYTQTANDHFIVHFPGVRDKAAAVRDFARKHGRHDTTLVPCHLLERYGP